MSALPDPATFSSGEGGGRARRRDRLPSRAADLSLDALLRLTGTPGRLDRLAEAAPSRAVVVASVYRPGTQELVAALAPLGSGRHQVRLAFGSTGAAEPRLTPETVVTGLKGGKFPNLNRIVEKAGAGADWLLVVDDDVVLPPRFLDRFIGVCERYGLALAQPAQSRASHAAWRHVRRRGLSLVRETRFVEIGPVTAFRRDVLEELAPFPPLRWGWGLDLAWAALAIERGWRLGVVDALPVRHESGPVAAGYGWEAAIAEAREFLADRPYLAAAAAGEIVAVHR